MQGFAAISAHNGWAMALLGFAIVVTGMAVLSIVISQLHRVLDYLDRGRAPAADAQDDLAGALSAPSPPGGAQIAEAQPAAPDRIPLEAASAAALYQPLIDQLEQPFELKRLYRLAISRGYPHPHLTISALRQSGFLVPQGDALFRWQRSSI